MRPKSFQIKDSRKVNFEKKEMAKSEKDETSPLFQPRNANFVPHRTDADGNVKFDEDEDIEQHTHWARRKALMLREEVLEEEVEESTFFTGRTDRQVFTMKTAEARVD